MRVRQAVLDAIAAHARREQPRECCGLLIGTDAEVVEAVAAANVAVDPTRRYEVSPHDHFAAIKRCRDRADLKVGPYSTGRGRSLDRPMRMSVIGGYHSHPHTAPEPSPTDLEQAFEGFLYLIAGPVSADTIEMRAYRLAGARFEPVGLEKI